MIKTLRKKLIISAALLYIAGGNSLTLQQVEQKAVKQAPELRQLQANAQALNEDAVADNQLSDPQLSVGALNVPTDTFSFTQENMTQVQVGLVQALPKGSTLSIHSSQDKLNSHATDEQRFAKKLAILRAVRLSWLNIYFWQQAISIYQQEQGVFEHQLAAHGKMLANNQTQQKDVVRSQLELSQIKQKISEAKQSLAHAQSNLTRWVSDIQIPSQVSLPTWQLPKPISQYMLTNHPVIKSDNFISQFSHQGIKLAEQQYKPGFKVGVMYGLRQGEDAMGNDRANFIGAQMTMDLPIFTAKRQDKRLKANQERYVAAQMKEQSDYRQLKENFDSSYADWQYLSDQHMLYQKHLVPEAKQYAKSTQIAYQNSKTDFPTLARAYVKEYNTQIAALKTQVNQLKAQASLMYLQGDNNENNT